MGVHRGFEANPYNVVYVKRMGMARNNPCEIETVLWSLGIYCRAQVTSLYDILLGIPLTRNVQHAQLMYGYYTACKAVSTNYTGLNTLYLVASWFI